MNVLNFTGLNGQAVAPVVNGLQQLLADFQVYYANLRGFHWNVKGEAFFQLHAKFEDLYDDAAEKVDEIAERILQLGGTPANTFSAYVSTAKVAEVSGVSCGNEALDNVLQTLQHLIASERALLSVADEAGDEVTVSLLSDYLKEQEKLVWMLVAYSTKK